MARGWWLRGSDARRSQYLSRSLGEPKPNRQPVALLASFTSDNLFYWGWTTQRNDRDSDGNDEVSCLPFVEINGVVCGMESDDVRVNVFQFSQARVAGVEGAASVLR